jgi:predicted ATPase
MVRDWLQKIFCILLIGVLVAQNGLASEIEGTYSIPVDRPIQRPNFVILSGCSGGGKSTILSELARRGYAHVPEPGRQIVIEQEAIQGDALPWVNLTKFLELALSRSIHQFLITEEKDNFVFFDRSIIDAINLDDRNNQYFWNAAHKFRYNKLVFLVPPWEEIYQNDSERKHSFQEAKREYDNLIFKYKKLNYEILIVPQESVQKRADYILMELEKKTEKPLMGGEGP